MLKARRARQRRTSDPEYLPAEIEKLSTFAYSVRSACDRPGAPAKLKEAMRLTDVQLEADGWGLRYALRSLWEEWNKIEPAERRVLLGGWSDPGMPPTRQHVLDYSAGVRRFLHVAPLRGEIEAIQDWYADDTMTCPVHLMISDGSSRAEVSAALHRLIDFVELEWNTLVAMRPSRDIFPRHYEAPKKSRRPEAATPVEPASIKGDRALTPAAA